MQQAIEALCAHERERFLRLSASTTPKFCDYHVGMFAHEPQDKYACFSATRITCFHEAGHAVASYVLGLGIGRGGIQIRETRYPAEGKFASLGSCQSTKAEVRAVNALLRRNAYGPILAKSAIVYAAGPAAERKYCIEEGLPLQNLGASEGDHKRISGIGKSVWNRSPQFRYALERFAWRKAQLLLENETVWSAVCDLADRLADIAPDEDDVEHDYSSFEIMPGHEVRRYLRDSFRAA